MGRVRSRRKMGERGKWKRGKQECHEVTKTQRRWQKGEEETVTKARSHQGTPTKRLGQDWHDLPDAAAMLCVATHPEHHVHPVKKSGVLLEALRRWRRLLPPIAGRPACGG